MKAIIAFIFISNAFLHLRTDFAASLVTEEPSPQHQSVPFQQKITAVDKNKIYSDFLFSNKSKLYVIEVQEEKCLLIFSFTTRDENATLKVNLEGPADRMQLSLSYYPMPYIYYVRSRGEVRIVITNPQRDVVHYRFFVDVSEPLRDNNSKILLLDGSRVAFHVDLRRDDKLYLNLNSSNHLHPRIRVFALCYEVVFGKGSYMLCFRKESLNEAFFFEADLGGRYYILVESVKGEGRVSLNNMIASPPWNQDWFWLVSNISFVTIISPFFIAKIKKARDSKRTASYALTGFYCWFITIGLSTSLIGSFNYGAPTFIPLFYLSVVFYGLSLGMQIYAAHLDRKNTIRICPYCGRRVDVREDNYCCGKTVKNISFAWFLTPLSFSILFFTIGYIIAEQILPQLLGMSLWIGSSGSIIGGIIAWRMNRAIERKPWKFLAEGILLSFFSPFLTGFLIDMSFPPHIELEWPGKLIRIRIAPLTLSFAMTLAFAIVAIGLTSMIVCQIRKLSR